MGKERSSNESPWYNNKKIRVLSRVVTTRGSSHRKTDSYVLYALPSTLLPTTRSSLLGRVAPFIEKKSKKTEAFHATHKNHPGKIIAITTGDNITIDARYYIGHKAQTSDPTVIICNDYFADFSDKNDFIDRYIQRGINVVSFNYRNRGKSQYSIASPLGPIIDAKAVCQYLINDKQLPAEKILLHGISCGAEVAAHIAADNPGLHLIIDHSFPKPCYGKNILHGKQKAVQWRKIANYRFNRVFLKHVYNVDIEKIVSRIKGKVCIVHTNAQKTALKRERRRTQQIFKAIHKKKPRSEKILLTTMLSTLMSIPHYSNNSNIHALAEKHELTKPILSVHDQNYITIKDRFGKNIFDNMISSLELDIFLYSIGFIDD